VSRKGKDERGENNKKGVARESPRHSSFHSLDPYSKKLVDSANTTGLIEGKKPRDTSLKGA